MRASSRILLALACLASSLGARAHASDGLAGLIADLDRVRREHHIAGAGFTLVNAEQVLWTGGLGVTNHACGSSVTADSLFRIGSITKAFTSLALLIAEDEGSLHLDDRLVDVAPKAPITNPWREQHPVRLAHLLEHTAGLADITRAEFDHNDPTPLTLEQGLAFAPEARRSLWPPGLHSSYSNAGAGLAGYALEQATGKRYEDFVATRLFAPLGMRSAGFILDKQARHRLVTGYDRDGVTVIPYWNVIFRPFGGINATPRDMAAFVQLLINRGKVKGRRVLSEAAIERMETPRTTLAARQGLRYGYGLGNYAFVHKGFVFHGHGGDADGYLSFYAYSRDAGLGYFVVIDAFNDDALQAMRTRIEDYIVRRLRPVELQEASIDTAHLSGLAGRYEAVTHRFPWTAADAIKNDIVCVELDGDRLYTRKPDDTRRPLVAVDAWRFRRPDEPVATMAFITYDGEIYLQGDLGNYRRTSASVSESWARPLTVDTKSPSQSISNKPSSCRAR